MEDLFRSYWWLLFPLAWLAFGGFSSFLNYRRQRATLKLIETYAQKGQEPPEALLRVLERPIDAETESRAYPSMRAREGNWFSVVLFGILAAGFGYAAYTDLYGLGEPATIVGFILGALAAAMLVQALMASRSRRD